MKKKSEEDRIKAWRAAWERHCPWCKAPPTTPCRGSDAITLSREASGLPALHLNR